MGAWGGARSCEEQRLGQPKAQRHSLSKLEGSIRKRDESLDPETVKYLVSM